MLVLDAEQGRDVNARLVHHVLGSLGLAKHEHMPVSKLSGGQSRRVALARALVSDYDVLVLDEPFKGLDQETKDLVIAHTRSSVRDKTVLLVTHDRDEATAMGARLVHL
jgi:NitT/TauT family transport system ATP-binding protein